MVVPLSVSLTSIFNLGMNLIAVVIFALANGVTPALSWLWMVPIILGFILLATGLSLLLSALYVRFRDVKPIWDVASQVLFYASPIMYTASHYHSLEHYALLSPIGALLTQMGHAFVHPAPVATIVGGHTVYVQAMRSASAAAGGSLHIAASIAIIFVVFALGWWVFTREAPRVAEHL
jgi:ABC-2 type transport system permease protein